MEKNKIKFCKETKIEVLEGNQNKILQGKQKSFRIKFDTSGPS